MRVPRLFLAGLSFAALSVWWPAREAPPATVIHAPPPAAGFSGPSTAAGSPSTVPAAASLDLARPPQGSLSSPAAEPAAAPLAVTLPPALPEASGPGVLSHWQGRLLTPLRAHAFGAPEELHLPLEFEFPLDGERRVPVRVHRLDFTGSDAGVLSGTVPGHPGSTVVLSFVGLAQAGVIHLPESGRAYVVNGDESGRLRITETDPRLAPGCTPPLRPPEKG